MRPFLAHLAARSLAVLALTSGLTSCSGDSDGGVRAAGQTAQTESPESAVPDRQPEVTGSVGFDDEFPASPHLVNPSDDYYGGMYLLRADPIVLGQDGDPLDGGDLTEGDSVAVWIDGGCAESFPVQCDVVAVEVRN